MDAGRWKVVQDWLVNELTEHGKHRGTLDGYRSVINTAFDLAVERQYLPYNPVQRFKLRVPKAAEKGTGSVILLEHQSPLIRAVTTRRDRQDRSDLSWLSRGMMIFIGFFTGMRNEEVSGLCWDCVNLVEREIYVRRIFKNGRLLDTTKTGEGGKRSIPMSPVLVAAFEKYRESMERMGREVTGAVSVLAARSKFVSPEAIGQNHWPVIANKAGFLDANGAHLYTFYDLRHTFATLLRSIGVQDDDLKELMGHSDYKTTVDNYIHRQPHLFAELKRQVKQAIKELDLDDTPEGLIDALGFVQARRWKDEGIEIACAPPRSVTERLAAAEDQLALPTRVLELTPNSAATMVSPGPLIKSVEDFRLYQRIQVIEAWKTTGLGLTRIAKEYGVHRETAKYWIDHADIRHERGRLKPELRQNLNTRVLAYFDQHPDTPNIVMARMFGQHTHRIAAILRGRGTPGRHRVRNRKLDQHEKQIQRWIEDGVTFREQQRLLEKMGTTVSFSALCYFAKKKGWKSKRWGTGLRVDQGAFDEDINRSLQHRL
jgi:integrase/transposase